MVQKPSNKHVATSLGNNSNTVAMPKRCSKTFQETCRPLTHFLRDVDSLDEKERIYIFLKLLDVS